MFPMVFMRQNSTIGGGVYSWMGSSSNGVEADMKYTVRSAGTVRNLIASLDNVGTGRIVLLRKNAADTALSINITDSTAETVSDDVDSVSLAVNDTFVFRVTNAGSPTHVWFGRALFFADVGHVALYQTRHQVITGTTTQWSGFTGADSGFTSIGETGVQTLARAAGTWKNLCAQVMVATTSTATLRSRKNTADGNQTVSITLNTTGTFADTSNTDAVASGDLIDYQLSGQSSSMQLMVASEISCAAHKHDLLVSASADPTINFNASNQFFGVANNRGSAGTTESNYQFSHGVPVTTSRMRINVVSNTNASASTWTLRKNGVSVTQTLSITAATTGTFEDTTHTDTFGATDLASYLITGGTSGSHLVYSYAITEQVLQTLDTTFVGGGTLRAGAAQRMDADITLNGAGTLSTALLQNMRILATLPGASTESVYANLRPMLAAGTSPGAGDFSVTAIDVKFGQATFSGLGSLSDDSLDFKPLLPDADNIDGTWLDQDRGTNLFAAVDEMIVSDADYIQSKSDPVDDICKISLSDPSGTPTQPFIVMYRYEKFGTRQIDLTVRLLEGTTQIASWTHTDIAGSFVTAEQTLTGVQFSSIGNFNNLFVEFKANAP